MLERDLRMTHARQRYAVAVLSAAMLSFTAWRLLDNPQTVMGNGWRESVWGVVTMVLSWAALSSLPFFLIGANWARRTLLIWSFQWSAAGLVGTIANRTWPIALLGLGALLVFAWLMHPVNRRHFVAGKRSWGFARALAGAAILLSRLSIALNPGQGPISLLQAENENEAAGMAFGAFLSVALGVWLLWSGIRKERLSLRAAALSGVVDGAVDSAHALK